MSARYATAAPAAPFRHLHATSYPGRLDQVRQLRRELMVLLDDSPAAEDIILCASELAANAVRHSGSGRPGGSFTLRVEIIRGECVCIAVDDDGGPWIETGSDSDRGRGLVIVTALSADWGIVAGPAGRTVWARFDWSAGP
jgi:anti-sigma regulatory factor (Ser/Thr protein kinase)